MNTVNLHQTNSQTHQNAPQAQISTAAMADATQLVKTLETPYLRDLRRLIDAEIMSRASTERRDAIVKIQQIAANVGIPLKELMSSASPRKGANTGTKRGPSEMKFRNPDDESQQWSGRGLAPKWVKDWEAKYGSRDGLLIKATN